MTDLMEHLYQYAQDRRMAAELADDPDYSESLRCAEAQEQALRQYLTGPGEARFKSLQGEQLLYQSAVERAAFRAGFAMAMELSRG